MNLKKALYEEQKRLALARLNTLDPEREILLGVMLSNNKITVRKIIEHIQKDDKFGKQAVQVQMKMLKILANNTEKNNKDIPIEIKKIIISRLEDIPSNLKMALGVYGSFDKQQLIEHVRKGDGIGKRIVAMELEFIKDLVSGKIAKFLAE
ncbi:MAG: hypothetical protein Q8L34_05880 [Candidatus Woesearchaeota archaeon]|nr:hypothetical protein [Candidatus Woesearchaeota archaeon]